MMAVLMEHTGGNWPFWLSPRQVYVIPVGRAFIRYANEIYQRIKSAGFSTDVGDCKKLLPKKINECASERWNYIAIVGANEEKARTITLIWREKPAPKDQFTVTIDEMLQLFSKLRDSYK